MIIDSGLLFLGHPVYRIPNFLCQNHFLCITSFKTIIRVLYKNMAQYNSNSN